MKKKEAQPIRDIIKQFLHEEHLDQGLIENRVVNSWEAVIGKTVARATTHVSINNGILYVKINSSVMRNELMMIRSKIADALNNHVGHHIVMDVVIQ
ncbi:DUF721 domain-containing protein [Saccharicrinis aurantiacus]|uniref:DUF721 domain-containing protein n=1 Tax=Saccharicrinis aurantiacus TaxID=1849719 RepID=UPI00094F50F6|nr:DUF721 domain-containing protein [Saccharicrinis aurantiacus]